MNYNKINAWWKNPYMHQGKNICWLYLWPVISVHFYQTHAKACRPQGQQGIAQQQNVPPSGQKDSQRRIDQVHDHPFLGRFAKKPVELLPGRVQARLFFYLRK